MAESLPKWKREFELVSFIECIPVGTVRPEQVKLPRPFLQPPVALLAR